MPSQKISQLTTKTNPVITDTAVIVDSVTGENRKVILNSLPMSSPVESVVSGKESSINKTTNLSSPNNIKFPTTLAVSSALELKQNSLGFTPENLTNKVTNLITPNNTTYPTSLAVSDELSAKQDQLGFYPQDSDYRSDTIFSSSDYYPTNSAVINYVKNNAHFYLEKDPKFKPHSGVLGETIIKQYSIPAFLRELDTFDINSIVCKRPTGEDTIYFRLRFSHTDYASSTVIATWRLGSGEEFCVMERTFTNDQSLLYGAIFTDPIYTDRNSSLGSNTAFDWKSDLKLYITSELFDASDSCEVGGIKIGT
jgi:hypothetical protein